MKNKRTDISQIRKYLNGELDARAMHQLEREAQSDPFLMDALDGYQQAEVGDQQNHMEALTRRLNERISGSKVKRMIPWQAITIAASVMGFMIVAGLLYFNRQTSIEQGKVANNVVPQQEKRAPAAMPDTVKQAKIAQPEPADNKIVFHRPARNKKIIPSAANSITAGAAALPLSENIVEAKGKAPADSAALEDMVIGYIDKQKQDTVLGGEYVAVNKNAASVSLLPAKADGVTVPDQAFKRTAGNNYELSKLNLPPGYMSGTVIARNDGAPLPGVSVKVVGKPVGTQTDANGKFSLPVKKDETVAFDYIGYNSKKLSVQGADTLKVEMDPNANTLREVMVAKTTIDKQAHPVKGWPNFQQYLQTNAVLPKGANAGTVSLSFIVKPDGSVTNIKVLKSLSAVADKQAQNLIINGPKWAGNLNGKPQTIKVDIEFTSPR